MSYVKNVWFDGETSGTPIIAEKMNHIEEGIEELSEALSSIDPVILFESEDWRNDKRLVYYSW